MTKSILDEADELLRQEKLQRETQKLNNEQQREKQIQMFIQQMQYCIPHMPVIQEVLFEHHKIIFDHYPQTVHDILKTQSGVGEYNCGPGPAYNKNLHQNTDMEDDEIYSIAWAISIESVFGKNVYLLPYKKYKVPSNGFACTVTSKGEYKFFPHDVPRQYAIEWLAAYKRKHPNI